MALLEHSTPTNRRSPIICTYPHNLPLRQKRNNRNVDLQNTYGITLGCGVNYLLSHSGHPAQPDLLHFQPSLLCPHQERHCAATATRTMRRTHGILKYRYVGFTAPSAAAAVVTVPTHHYGRQAGMRSQNESKANRNIRLTLTLHSPRHLLHTAPCLRRSDNMVHMAGPWTHHLTDPCELRLAISM